MKVSLLPKAPPPTDITNSSSAKASLSPFLLVVQSCEKQVFGQHSNNGSWSVPLDLLPSAGSKLSFEFTPLDEHTDYLEVSETSEVSEADADLLCVNLVVTEEMFDPTKNFSSTLSISSPEWVVMVEIAGAESESTFTKKGEREEKEKKRKERKEGNWELKY
jgi:hypothetical protein